MKVEKIMLNYVIFWEGDFVPRGNFALLTTFYRFVQTNENLLIQTILRSNRFLRATFSGLIALFGSNFQQESMLTFNSTMQCTGPPRRIQQLHPIITSKYRNSENETLSTEFVNIKAE